MIMDHCKNNSVNRIKDFQPILLLFDKMDRPVDIMNGHGFSKGKDQDGVLINEPRHRHISELFNVLCVFIQ